MFKAASGGLQGSALGPLLFLLFIIDLCVILFSKKLNDLKIYSCINTIEDCIYLQSQLNIIYKWCCDNTLNLI